MRPVSNFLIMQLSNSRVQPALGGRMDKKGMEAGEERAGQECGSVEEAARRERQTQCNFSLGKGA